MPDMHMNNPKRAVRKRRLDALAELVDLGISPDSVSADQMRRIRAITITTLALFAIGVPTALQFLRLELTDLAVATLCTITAGALNLLLLHTTRRTQLAGHLGLLILAGMLTTSNIATGGFYNPNFAWFYVLPLGAAVIIDVRGAAMWTGITLAITLCFWALPDLGIVLPDRIPEDMRNGNALFTRATGIIAIAVCGASFVISQRRAEQQLASANADLSLETSYVQLLMHAAVSANQASSFADAMRDSVQLICTTLDWATGHVCDVNEDGAVSSSGFFHTGEPERFAELRQEATRSVVGIGEGLLGTALATGKPRHSEDLAAASHGIVTGFAVPILVNGKVEAVLEFGHTKPVPNTERLLEVFSHIGVQLGRVAERTSMQERRRQSQKMEAIGRLAAGLAHEINNPMSYVRSNLHSLRGEWQALRSKIAPPAESPKTIEHFDDCQELIEDSLEGVERTISIVRDMKEFSRSGGADREEWESVELRGLVESALRVAIPQASSGLRFSQEHAESVLCHCAPNPLRQVFVNLIVNAIQAIGDNPGHIRLSTGVTSDGLVFAKFEDDGPGMSRAVRERLFDPFFTTKPVGEGTGLGLSVSYEIIRSHGGDILVHSEIDNGSSFEVRLPAYQELSEA